MSRFCHCQWAVRSPELLGRGTLPGSVILPEPRVCLLKMSPTLTQAWAFQLSGLSQVRLGKAEAKGLLGKVRHVETRAFSQGHRKWAQLDVLWRSPGAKVLSPMNCACGINEASNSLSLPLLVTIVGKKQMPSFLPLSKECEATANRRVLRLALDLWS